MTHSIFLTMKEIDFLSSGTYLFTCFFEWNFSYLTFIAIFILTFIFTFTFIAFFSYFSNNSFYVLLMLIQKTCDHKYCMGIMILIYKHYWLLSYKFWSFNQSISMSILTHINQTYLIMEALFLIFSIFYFRYFETFIRRI